MAKFLVLLVLAIAQITVAFLPITPYGRKYISSCSKSILNSIKKDEQGYIIKDRDWFQGLSLDAGAR